MPKPKARCICKREVLKPNQNWFCPVHKKFWSPPKKKGLEMPDAWKPYMVTGKTGAGKSALAFTLADAIRRQADAKVSHDDLAATYEEFKARHLAKINDFGSRIAEAEKRTEDSILLKAEKAVNGPRARDYGHPRVNHTRIAKLWSAILGRETSPEEVALCMMAVKMARLMESPLHEDSAVDIAGYSWVFREIAKAAPEKVE